MKSAKTFLKLSDEQLKVIKNDEKAKEILKKDAYDFILKDEAYEYLFNLKIGLVEKDEGYYFSTYERVDITWEGGNDDEISKALKEGLGKYGYVDVSEL